MGRPKGSKNKSKKSPYADLPDEWKNKVMYASWEALDEEIAAVTKAEEENQQMKADDPDLASLKAEVREASAQYREATKTHKLKIKYLIELQEARGRPVKRDVQPVEPVVRSAE